jgi:hypothetical protein
VRLTIEKLSIRVTTLFQTSSQLEVYTQSYIAPKLRKSQLWEFRDSHLGIPGQNVIWMWASWRGIEYTIRGKVVVSPKSGPWWVLWIRVCPWLILTPKGLQLCINQLVVWFCAGPCEWLSVYHSSSSHPATPARPSPPKVLWVGEHVPNSLFFHCFHFKVTFESIKELGSASQC